MTHTDIPDCFRWVCRCETFVGLFRNLTLDSLSGFVLFRTFLSCVGQIVIGRKRKKGFEVKTATRATMNFLNKRNVSRGPKRTL